MQGFIYSPHTLTTTFAEITIEGTIEPFIAGIIFIGMIVALMLPILAIPYIFIKMGSVAAKLQSMGNNMVKRTAAGKNAVGKAAHGAAGRQWDRKAGQWAARGDGSLKSKVGGYKTQRDFKRSQLGAAAKRNQEDALARRIQTDPRYAASSGGDHARAAAQAVIEKRDREETENAMSQLRAAGIYHPDRLVEVAQGNTSVVGTKGAVDASQSLAMQRAATAQLVSAQDAGALEKLVTSDGTDKQMVYEEIQKKYSDAKAAGAHLVKFTPGAPGPNGRATGWSQEKVKTEAAKALSSLSAEKLAGQDGPAAQSAVEGYKILVEQIRANPLPPPPAIGPVTQEQADRAELVKALQTLKATAQSVNANAQMKAKAKEGTRSAIETILTLPDV